MENRINIVNEMMELSPVLAQMKPVLPYEVPQGYFDRLPEKMLDLALASQDAPALFDNNKLNPYNLPNGYFENLADTILNRIRAAEAGSANEEIEALSPVLSKLNKQSPYQVPANYFAELADNIADGAKAIQVVNDELENLSPLMNNLKGKNVYAVPVGYFESLADSVLAKAKQQQPSKVISISFKRKMIQYASAAIVAGLIVTAGFIYFTQPAKPTDTPVEESVAKDLKNTSDAELFNFIESEDNTVDETAATATASEEIATIDMKDMLADVSDDELQQYIEETTPENNNSVTN